MKKDIDELALQAFEIATANEVETIVRLLTEREKIALGRRILIAQAILSGKTRFEINDRLQVSPNTFAQMNRWLENEFSEYVSSYQKNNQRVSKKHASKFVPPFSYENLKKKYPTHFLLFSLIEEMWKQK